MSDVIYNISSGFFDSVNGDRLYSAGDMNKPYKRVIADGIFPTPQGTPSTDFQVVAVSGMSVAVLAGNAMIGARWAENTDDVGITIAGNSSSSPRIDSIFLHIDTGIDTRAAGVVYRQGTAAGTPTAPAMVQTDNITELRLADILVAPSAAIITQANITDQRGGSDCPWVAGLIQQVDTSALFDQYRAAYAEQQQDQADEWSTFMDHLARDYDISMSLRKHESTYTSTAAASLIPINIDGYDTTKDLLQVYINGIFAVEGTHYIVKSAAQIQLTNAISAGQNVHFVIYKAVMGGAQPIIPTDDQVQDAVDAYMDAHPGALVVDPELSDTSTHAIQNKAVTEALAGVNGRLGKLITLLDYSDTMERADNPTNWRVGYVRENGSIGESTQRIINRTVYAGNGKSCTITMDTGWALEKVCEYSTAAFPSQSSFDEMIFVNEGVESVTVTLKAGKYYVFQIRKDPVQTVESTDDITDDTIIITYPVKTRSVIDDMQENIASARMGVKDVKESLNFRTEYSPVAFSTEQGGYTSSIGEEITFDTVPGWKKTSFVPEIGNRYKITFYNTSGNTRDVSYVCEVDSNNIVLAVHGTIDKSQSIQQNEVIISPLTETAAIWIKGKNGAEWPFTINKVVINTEIDGIKDSVTEVSSTLYKKIDIDAVWVQGAIKSVDGQESISTTRIRTRFIPNDGVIYKVDVPSEYKVAAFLYGSSTIGSYVGCWDGATAVEGTLTWLQEIRLDAISYRFVRLVVSKTNGDTIDVDEANACSFYAKTIEEEIRNTIDNIIDADGNLNSGMVANSTIDDATGILIRNTSYRTTNFIKLPKWETNQRYNPYTKLYIKSYDSTSYDTHFTKAVFYRIDKTVHSIATSENELDIPSDAVYVRVVFPSSNTYFYVGCGILTDAPTYQPYHKTVSDNYIPSIANQICNSDGAKTNLVKTALQYLGNTDFGYGNTHTAYSASAEAVESDGVTSADGSQSDTKCYDGTKFQIDCSGFTRLVMQCVYPEYTRHYGKTSNIVPPWGYRYDENAEYDTPQGRLTAHKQALYAYQRGFMYPLKDDYSNAEVGDMIFVANSSSMWGGIGHARIITNAIPLKTGGKQITVMESNSYLFPPVHASKSTQRELNQFSAARFPLPYATGGIDIIGTAEPSTVQTSSADGVIVEISLSELTRDKEIYTIVFKANFDSSDNYAVVTGLGNSISFANVLVYNGLHVYTVVLPVDGSAGSNTVVIKAHEADTVTFGGAKIYKGFHTPTMSEFN